MFRCALIPLLVCQLTACDGATADAGADRKALAERFFRGVYGCVPSVVPDLAGDSVLISYPIFDELFKTPVIRGREDVDSFAAGFCTRWKDAQILIHETIGEEDRVVLMWSFRARNVASSEGGRWGGISLFRFDDAGSIIAEIGEESEPGPFERLTDSTAVR